MTRPEPLSIEVLLSRGYCCGSGCLNCPYEPKHTKGVENSPFKDSPVPVYGLEGVTWRKP